MLPFFSFIQALKSILPPPSTLFISSISIQQRTSFSCTLFSLLHGNSILSYKFLPFYFLSINVIISYVSDTRTCLRSEMSMLQRFLSLSFRKRIKFLWYPKKGCLLIGLFHVTSLLWFWFVTLLSALHNCFFGVWKS